MAMSTDVNLPKSHEPVFPDRCIVCDHDSPGSQMRYASGTVGWWTVVFWSFGKRFVVRPPACKGCSRKLHVVRFGSLIVTLSLAALSISLVWPSCKDHIAPMFHKWAMMGLAILSILPQIAYEVFWAREFSMTVFKNNVEYEFGSKEYAVDFAALNCDAAWVKVNGNDILD